MKIDFTVKFAKDLHTTYKIVDGELKIEKTDGPLYTVLITDNLLDRERYDFTTKAKFIPEIIFRFLTLDENILDIDESFYEKHFVGWYSLNENMREFLTPTKAKKLYEYMFNHMRDYTDSRGTLILYFELV